MAYIPKRITFCVKCLKRVKDAGICEGCKDKELVSVNRYKYPKPYISAEVKAHVMSELCCHICKDNILAPGEFWTIDHIIPLSVGGTSDRSNLAKSHNICNSTKARGSDKDMLKQMREGLVVYF